MVLKLEKQNKATVFIIHTPAKPKGVIYESVKEIENGEKVRDGKWVECVGGRCIGDIVEVRAAQWGHSLFCFCYGSCQMLKVLASSASQSWVRAPLGLPSLLFFFFFFFTLEIHWTSSIVSGYCQIDSLNPRRIYSILNVWVGMHFCFIHSVKMPAKTS